MKWKLLWPVLTFSAAIIVALIYDGLRSIAMAGLWSYTLQQFWHGMALFTIMSVGLTPWVKQIRLVSAAALLIFAIAAINRIGIYVSLSFMGFNYWQTPHLMLVPALFLIVTILTAIGVFGWKREILVGTCVIAIALSPIIYSEAKHIELKASNTSLQPTSVLTHLLG
ncbi:MAG: hypothetical protein ABW104_08570 [Candidatus Thiodiazotropha sp. 6PLUC2]